MNTETKKTTTNIEFWSPRRFDAKGDYRLHGILLNAGDNVLAALSDYFRPVGATVKKTPTGFFVSGLCSEPIFVCTDFRN